MVLASKDVGGMRPGLATQAGRLMATPLARRVALQHRINLAHVRGSGPRGRIVAADVVIDPTAREPATAQVQLGAFSCTLDLRALNAALNAYLTADLDIEAMDAFVRAAGCALAAVNDVVGTDVAIAAETAQRLVICHNAGAAALSALHSRRVGTNGDIDLAAATLSVMQIRGEGVIPTLLPMLPGFNMRLLIVTAEDLGQATLLFTAAIESQTAASILAHLKRFIERPALMLA